MDKCSIMLLSVAVVQLNTFIIRLMIESATLPVQSDISLTQQQIRASHATLHAERVLNLISSISA
jgi:hypothetical protein